MRPRWFDTLKAVARLVGEAAKARGARLQAPLGSAPSWASQAQQPHVIRRRA